MLDLEGFTALLDAPTRRDLDARHARIEHLTVAEPVDFLDPFAVTLELDADTQPGDAGTCEFGTP